MQVDRLLELPLITIGITLTVLHCAIGIMAAILAQQKGLSFRHWIWLGLLGGSIALIVVLRSPCLTDKN